MQIEYGNKSIGRHHKEWVYGGIARKDGYVIGVLVVGHDTPREWTVKKQVIKRVGFVMELGCTETYVPQTDDSLLVPDNE